MRIRIASDRLPDGRRRPRDGSRWHRRRGTHCAHRGSPGGGPCPPEARSDLLVRAFTAPVLATTLALALAPGAGAAQAAADGTILPARAASEARAGGAAASAAAGGPVGVVPGEFSPSAPIHCTHPRARDFDFWIGEWDVLNRQRPPDGVGFYETGRSTDRVYPVVGGCGIVEHWRGDAFRFILGFSIRAYDPAEDEWTIVLLWPTNGRPSFGELRGGFRHGRGEFSFRWVRPDGDTATNRFTFSDITPNSLRWENATSRDGGLTWMGNWIMEFTRRDPVADIGLWNGPTITTRRCPAEEYRRFVDQLGEWAGVRTTATGDSIPLRAHFVRILEGCAVMERVWSPERAYEAFRVRAYEPDADRWVLYELDSERRTLVRREAEGRDSPHFREVSPASGEATRLRWDPGEDGAPGWVVETADGADGPWRTSATVRLDQPIGGLGGT